MGHRSMRINFRSRAGISALDWNWFFENLNDDLEDLIGLSGMITSGVIVDWDTFGTDFDNVMQYAGSGDINWLENI